jgi:hypothetical protein
MNFTRGAFDEEVDPEATKYLAGPNGYSRRIHQSGRDAEVYGQF